MQSVPKTFLVKPKMFCKMLLHLLADVKRNSPANISKAMKVASCKDIVDNNVICYSMSSLKSNSHLHTHTPTPPPPPRKFLSDHNFINPFAFSELLFLSQGCPSLILFHLPICYCKVQSKV